jgi:hypothetical protein
VSEEDAPLELADLSSVLRTAYIVGHLKKLSDVVEEADRIYAGFPKELKEQLSCDECGHDLHLDRKAKGKLAVTMAQLSPDVRSRVSCMLQEVTGYINGWLNDEEPSADGELFGMLDKRDMAMIEEMLAFIQKVGGKSTRHLLSFFTSANEGEHGYLIIEAKGSKAEIRQRYSVSDESLREFGL